MKRMMFLGALILGVTVCTQSFGFELLDRMLGHKGCASCCEPGCGAGNGCAEPGCGAGNGCAEPACDAGNGCCEPACGAASCCGVRKKHDLFGGLKGLLEKCKRKHHGCTGCCGAEPACDAGNGCAEPACGAGNGCAEPACDAGNGCCEPACGAASCCGGGRKKCDLFGGLKGLFEKCKRKHAGCCDSCCEPACGAGNGCAEPACDAGNGCCEPACGAASCVGGCGKKGTPIRDLLRAIHDAKKACKRGCCDSCCSEPDCSAGCEPGCGAEPACGAGNGCVESAAAPTPDASASKTQSKVVAVSRTVAAK